MAIKTENFVEVASIHDFKDGEMKGYTTGGKKVLLARVGDQFYAASDVCPHMGATLSRGKLAGTLLTCPRHNSQFDLKDGHVVRWTRFTGVALALNNVVRSPRPLPVYPVKVQGDMVLVNLGKD